MTSVDATARVPGGTRPNHEGPFYRAAPLREDGDLFAGDPPAGTPVLHLSGRVTDAATGAPIPGAIVDLWQADHDRSEEHTSELQSLLRNSYAVFCLKKKKTKPKQETT